mgnify:CR=1 FL=1
MKLNIILVAKHVNKILKGIRYVHITIIVSKIRVRLA